MSRLALFGGQPTIENLADWRDFWPPVDTDTERKLLELYRSRRWTAFDEIEPAFAQAFAEHHGAAHGVFMMNGTVTLQCALGAYGIGEGDEVIVPAYTWYATAMAPYYLRAKPVFVDIDPDTLCIDPAKVEAAITPATKAIIPVHLFGSMADMDELLVIAKKHNLRVIEDCAHVHGGVWAGKGIGSVGDVGSFSFQHSKTMAAGEGGICITQDPQIAERIYRMKHIGYGPGQHPGNAPVGPPAGLLCYPFRATAFQALILHEQLRSLDALLRRYADAVDYLETRLGASTKIRFQKRGAKVDRQGYFAWTMMFDDPAYAQIPIERIQKALEAEGVPATQPWGPVYRFILFNLKPQNYRIDQPCEVAERVTPRILRMSHPYLGLERAQLEKIAEGIEKVMAQVHALRTNA